MSHRRTQQSGRHRKQKVQRQFRSVQWLRVGVVTAGLGAAVVTGQGIATASPGDDSGTSSANGGSTDATAHSQPTSNSTDPSGIGDAGSARDGAEDADPSDDETSSDDTEELDDSPRHDAVESEVPQTEDGVDGNSSFDASGDDSARTVEDEDETHDPVGIAPEDDAVLASDDEAGALEDRDVVRTTASVTATGVSATQDTQAPLVRPVNLQTIVADVMHWIGLGPLASRLPAPPLPVPTFVESLWLAVREHQYRWNNQRPTASVTLSGQDPHTGVVTGKIDATDHDDSTLTFIVSTDPMNGAVVVDAAGNFTYTPTAAFAAIGGSDTFAITIDDRVGNPEHYCGLLGLVGLLGPASARVRVSVSPITPRPNQSPQAGTPPFEFSVDDETGAVVGSVNAADPDGDPLYYQLTDAIDPLAGTLDLDTSAGTWVFTPSDLARYQAWATPGPDVFAFSVWVSDGVDRIKVDVEAPIAAFDTPNSAPEIADPAYGYTVNTVTGVVRGTVAVSDPDGDTLRYRITGVPDPSVGIAVINAATGQWAFRPTAQARFNAWRTGEEVRQSFSITVTDGRASVVITVEAPISRAATLNSAVVDGVGVSPAAIAVGSDGRVYVASTGDGTVRVLNADGSELTSINVGGSPYGLAIGPDGRVYVGDPLSGKVSVISTDGVPAVQTFATVTNAAGIAVGSDGRVYVSSVSGGALTVFGADGAILRTVGLGGMSPGVAVGADGRIYAAVVNATYTGGNVRVFNADGVPLDAFGVGSAMPYSVAVDTAGRIYVTDVSGGLRVLNPDGTTWKSVDLANGPATGVAVGADGRIYVTDINGDLHVLTAAPVAELPSQPTLDPATGAVSGALDVLNPGGFSFELDLPLDPALGVVEVDSVTGTWVFTPTVQARRAAVTNPAAASVSFGIVVSGGPESVTVMVTAPIDPDSSPEVETPPFTITDVDEVTGKVAGRVRITDLDGDPLLYLVATGIDPTRGRVTIDVRTGEFTYTPTELATHHAWFTPGEDSASFTILATDGESDARVVVTVPISARHPGQDGALTASELSRLAALGDILLARNDDGTIRAIDGTFTLSVVTNAAEAAEVLNGIAELLGASEGFADPADITGSRVELPARGNQASVENYYVLKPTVGGVPVLGGEIVVVADDHGVVTAVFSSYDSRLDGFDITPSVIIASKEDAAAAAAASLAGDVAGQVDPAVLDAIMANLSYDSELVIYAPDPTAEPVLVWQVTVSTTPIPADPDTEGQQDTSGITLPLFSTVYYFYADGPDAGSVLARSSTRDHAWSPVLVAADDFDSSSPAYIYVEKDGVRYRLVDTNRKITIYNTAYHGFGGIGAPVVGEDIIEFGDDRWDDNGNEEGAWAMANMAKIYDFFKGTLGWDFNQKYANGIKVNLGYDNQRSGWDNVVGYGGWGYEGFENAAWNWGNDQFEIGDGRWEAALDVLAHEYTHAVIEKVIGEDRWSRGQLGAMNEAYADILGVLIENKPGAARWIVGEDATVTQGQRDLSNPDSKVAYKNEQTQEVELYRDHFSEFYRGSADSGGVHINSTILSHAAYLMMEDDARTAGIGRDEWAGVFFRSLNMRPTSFVDARTKIIRAAITQGFNSDQIAAIECAFDRVGIESAYTPPSPSSEPDAPVVTLPIEGLSLPGTADTWSKPVFTPDGNRAVLVVTYNPVYGFGDGATTRVVVIDAATGEQVGNTFTTAGAGAVEFIDQGRRALVTSAVASGSGSGYDVARISVLDMTSGNQIGRTLSLGGYVHATGFNSDDTVAVITLSEGNNDAERRTKIVLVDTRTGRLIGAGLGIEGASQQVEFNAAGTRAMVLVELRADPQPGYKSHRLLIVDTTTGAQVGAAIDLPRGESYLTANADGSRVVAVTYNLYPQPGNPQSVHELRIVNTATGAQIGSTTVFPGTPRIATVVGNRFLTAGYIFEPESGYVSTPVAVFDTITGTQIGGTITVPNSGLGDFAFNRDGTTAAITMNGPPDSNISRVLLIDMITGAQIGPVNEIRDGFAQSVQFSASGTRVTVVVRDDVAEQTRLVSISAVTALQVGQTLNLSANPQLFWDNEGDGRYVIVAEQNSALYKRITIFDTTTGETVGLPTTLPVRGIITGARISDDGARAIVTMFDNSWTDYDPEVDKVLVWTIDTDTGYLLNNVVKISASGATSIAFVGDRAVVVGTDESYVQGVRRYRTEIAVIDTATGEQLGQTLAVSGTLVTYRSWIQIDPTGSRAIVVTSDGQMVADSYVALTNVVVVSTASGVQIGETLTISGGAVGDLQFTAQGDRAALIALIGDPAHGTARTHLILIDPTTGEVINGSASST